MELTTSERRTSKCFSLSPSLLDQLDKMPRRSVSRWVEETLKERLNKKDTAKAGQQDK